MELKLTKYNRDCWRIEDESGIVRYMALALTNGRWSLVDAEDRRVSRKTFSTPQEVYDEAMSIARLSGASHVR